MLSESQATSIKQVELHKSILHWRKGGPSHCLLRILAEQSSQQVVVVLSSLASNQLNLDDISLDFEAVVRTIVRDYRNHLGDDLEQVTWLLHFGRFSEPLSYTTMHIPEAFVLIQLAWENQGQFTKSGEKTMTPFKLSPLLPWLTLPAVEEELTALQDLSGLASD